MGRYLLIAVAALWSFAAVAGDTQYTVEIEGLYCDVCIDRVEKQVQRIEGVAGTQTDLDSGRMVVDVREGATLNEEDVRSRVEDAGYTFRGMQGPEA